MSDTSNPPKSTSTNPLREQILRLIVENRNSLNDPTTNEPYDMQGIADEFLELLTAKTTEAFNMAHGAVQQKCEEAAKLGITDPNWYHLAIRKELDDRLEQLQHPTKETE